MRRRLFAALALVGGLVAGSTPPVAAEPTTGTVTIEGSYWYSRWSDGTDDNIAMQVSSGLCADAHGATCNVSLGGSWWTDPSASGVRVSGWYTRSDGEVVSLTLAGGGAVDFAGPGAFTGTASLDGVEGPATAAYALAPNSVRSCSLHPCPPGISHIRVSGEVTLTLQYVLQ